jgi:hypothetical protein
MVLFLRMYLSIPCYKLVYFDAGCYYNMDNTECPTRYRSQHFFNNSNTNENIARKLE